MKREREREREREKERDPISMNAARTVLKKVIKVLELINLVASVLSSLPNLNPPKRHHNQ